ncbi:MAG: hypothetical protein WBA51_20060 [Erythrobacter sp.]
MELFWDIQIAKITLINVIPNFCRNFVSIDLVKTRSSLAMLIVGDLQPIATGKVDTKRTSILINLDKTG